MHTATRTKTARNALRAAGIEILEARATQHDVTTVRVYTAPHYAPTNGADAEAAIRAAFDGADGIKIDVRADTRQTHIAIYDYAATAAVMSKARPASPADADTTCPAGVRGEQRRLFLSLTDEQRRVYRYHFDTCGRLAAHCYRIATGQMEG